MRFLADMGISQKTVAWLVSKGHEAVHLRTLGLQRLPDSQIVEKARSEQRIVLTLDLDFGYLMAVSGEHLPSVIIFRVSDERSEFVTERLSDVLETCARDLEAGAVISVADSDARVRRLPLR